MSERLADVENRIGTVHKLATVISAMRGIAASRAREARRHVDGIRVFAATIGSAIGGALTLEPAPDRGAPAPTPTDARRAVVVLAAEQGFAGAFSERVFDAAAPLLAVPHELILAGNRGLLVATERGIAVDWSAAMIAHPAQVGALAARLTEAVYERLAAGQISSVSVVHAAPAEPGSPEDQAGAAGGTVVVTKQLVPFDYSRFPAPATGIAPLTNLPPARLAARLAEEYVFSEFSEAVMLSFAAENEARMRAMIAAHDNVTASLDELVASARRLRQEEITAEIVELATATLPAR
jgi:F-type H+-transporting ATPase subunit gamma